MTKNDQSNDDYWQTYTNALFMHLELTSNHVFDFEMQMRKNHEISPNLMSTRYNALLISPPFTNIVKHEK